MDVFSMIAGFFASMLGLGGLQTANGNKRDSYGGNGVDREYITYLHDMVNQGKMTEAEAMAKVRSKWNGSGNPDDYYNSYSANANGSTSVGGFNSSLPGLGALINSLTAYYTRNELTGAEREMNEFSAGEAQLSRNFTEYMARNKYSMETQSMQDAGVNPAMVYGGGSLVPTAANGAAASSSSIGAGNIADLLGTMIRMPLEMKRLGAEIDATRANTELTRQKTRTEEQNTRIYAINADYQDRLNSQTLSNLRATYDNTIADTDKKTADRDYVITQKDAQVTLNKYLDEQQKALLDKTKAEKEKISAEEKKTKAEKVYQDWYNNFVQTNDILPSSNDALMVATYIASLFGIGKDDVESVIHDLFEHGNLPNPNKGKDKPMNKAWQNEFEQNGWSADTHHGGSR